MCWIKPINGIPTIPIIMDIASKKIKKKFRQPGHGGHTNFERELSTRTQKSPNQNIIFLHTAIRFSVNTKILLESQNL